MKRRVKILKTPTSFAEGGQSYSQDDLATVYLTVLSQDGASVDDAENALRQMQVDEDTIKTITAAVEEFTEGEQDLNNAESNIDSDDYLDVSADQAALDNATALEQAEAEARSQRMQAMYDNYGVDDNTDYSDDYQVASDIVTSRTGGVPSKRQYLKNVMNLLKKQEGGDQENNVANSTDILDGRNAKLSAFVSDLQRTANENSMLEDAKMAYQQLTTPIGGDESYYDTEDLDEAQFGMNMSPRQQRRFNRRVNRLIRRLPVGFQGALPGIYTLPSFLTSAGMQMQDMFSSPNLQVTRYGLFGQPKEWSMNFGDPITLQSILSNPKAVEEVAKQEAKNVESKIEDVTKEEPQDVVVEKTVNDEGDEEIVDINDIQVVSSNRAPRGSYTPAASTDKFGRSQDDKWYGFDPKTKKWANDRWGRTPDDDWYGFNPETKEWTTAKKSAPPKKDQNVNARWSSSNEDLSGIDYNDAYQGSFADRQKLNERLQQQEFENIKFKDKPKKQAPKKSSSSSLAKTVDWNKIENTAEDTYRSLPDANVVSKAVGWNKIKNATSDLYRSLPDAPSNQQLINWGILGSQPIYDENTGRYYYPKRQMGGFADQNSGLYRFMYGGDDFSIPETGKLTGDPYFSHGGLHKAGPGEEVGTEKEKETPAYLTKEDLDNWWKSTQGQQNRTGYRDPYSGWDGTGSMPYYTTSNAPEEWMRAHPEYYNQQPIGYGMPMITTQQRGLPVFTNTGQTYTGDLSGALPARIKVDKSFALGPQRGMPKKYEITYRVPANSIQAQQAAAQPKKGIGRLFNRNEQVQDIEQDQTQLSGNPMYNAAYALSNTPGLRWLGAQALKKVRIPGDYSMPEESFQDRAMKNALQEGYTEIPESAIDPASAEYETMQNRAMQNAMNEGYTEIPDETVSGAQALTGQTPLERMESFAGENPSIYSGTEDAFPMQTRPLPNQIITQEQLDRGPVIGMNNGMPIYGRPDIPYLEPGQVGAMSPDQIAGATTQGYDLLRDYNRPEEPVDQNFMIERMMLDNPGSYLDEPYASYEEMSNMYTGDATTPQPIATSQSVANNYIKKQKRLGKKVQDFRTGQPAPAPVQRRQAPIVSQPPAKAPQKVVTPNELASPSNKESIQKTYQKNLIAGLENNLEQQLGYENMSNEDIKLLRQTYAADIEQFKKLPLRSQYRLIKTLRESKNPESKEKAYILARSVRLNYAQGGLLPKAQQYNSITGKSPIIYDPRFGHDAAEMFQTRAQGLMNENPFGYLTENALTGQKTMGLDETGEKLRNEGLLEDYGPDAQEYVDVTARYRNKRNRSNEDYLTFLNTKNAIGNFLVSSLDGRGDRRKRLQQYLRTIPQDSTGLYDRGNEQINAIGNTMVGDTGFRGIDAGQTARYGGSYKVGGQTWMTPKQVADYLARGGELEFI